MLGSLGLSAADDEKETQRMEQGRRLCLMAVLGLLSVLPCAVAHAQQPKSIGQVTAIDGKVTVLRQGKFAPESLTVRKSERFSRICSRHLPLR
jgi:hypothetical protein